MQKNPFAQPYRSSPAHETAKNTMATLPGRKEGLITRRTARRPGVRQQNVLSPRQVGALNIDILVARTPKPAMCGGLRKTAVALVVRRDRKGTFVRRYRCISCVRTEVHMFTCLFVHICLHMTNTNVILRNMRITTFLTTQLDEACAHP
jgi:hypothetical protein